MGGKRDASSGVRAVTPDVPPSPDGDPQEPLTRVWARRLDPRRLTLDPRRITEGSPIYPLVVLFGLNMVDELDQTAFNVLAPEIRDHFGLSSGEILLVVALAAPVALLIGLPLAYYADRSRRTALAAGGGAVWAGFSLFTGAAPNVPSLLGARAGSALGKAVNQPTHNSLLSDYYPVGIRAKIYAAHRAATHLGRILGPLLGGILAFLFLWRAPFIAFAAITAVFVVMAFGLKEPARGAMDRRAMGADEETAAIEEPAPGFGESWRLLHSVVTLRRLYFALPLLAGAIVGIESVIALFYEEVYDVAEAGRGALVALDEPFSMIGLALGAPIAHRLMREDPGRALRFIAWVGPANGLALALIAISPGLPVAVAGSWLSAFVRAILTPTLFAIFSLVIPGRVRSMGFAAVAVWTLPGLVVLPIIGGIGDSVGFRWAILVLIPLYVLGAFVLSTAAPFVRRDIDNNHRWSLLEAEKRKERVRIRRAVEDGEVDPSDVPLLDVRNIEFSYGPIQVLFDTSIQVPRGGKIALLGTNGAGKSTLLKVISGLLEPDPGSGGSIWFEGEDVTFTLPEERAALGIVQIPGGKATFPSLTVEENLRMGAYPFLDDGDRVSDRVEEVLELFPVLRERGEQRAGTLSGGEQQMMVLGRALIAGPQLLMIDELSLGLAPVVMEDILRMVDEIVARGTTLLIVEQSLNVAVSITEDAYFMEKGEIRFSGPTEELLDRGDLVRSVFFGEGRGP